MDGNRRDNGRADQIVDDTAASKYFNRLVVLWSDRRVVALGCVYPAGRKVCDPKKHRKTPRLYDPRLCHRHQRGHPALHLYPDHDCLWRCPTID